MGQTVRVTHGDKRGREAAWLVPTSQDHCFGPKPLGQLQLALGTAQCCARLRQSHPQRPGLGAASEQA